MNHQPLIDKDNTIKVKSSELPASLLDKIRNPDPLEGEDLIIEDESGRWSALSSSPMPMRFS